MEEDLHGLLPLLTGNIGPLDAKVVLSPFGCNAIRPGILAQDLSFYNPNTPNLFLSGEHCVVFTNRRKASHSFSGYTK